MAKPTKSGKPRKLSKQQRAFSEIQRETYVEAYKLGKKGALLPSTKALYKRATEKKLPKK